MDTTKWQHLTHMIRSYNPYGRRDRELALPVTLWAAFGYYLEQADAYAVLYYPPDPAVAPLLTMGATVEPTWSSPEARELRGALTAAVRAFLWAGGQGQLPWYAVDLFRDGELVFEWIEHEQYAFLVATEADLHELHRRGAEPELIHPWDGPGSHQQRTAKDVAVNWSVDRFTWPGPLERLPNGRIDRPARDEWLRMLALVGQRAETPEALDRLWRFQQAAFLLRDAPREGHLIIECHENGVRWRRLDAPSEPPTAGR